MPRTRVFVGASLDGFIAGPNDELDWLSGGDAGDGEEAPAPPDTFREFFAEIGAVLMGRRTYDIVCGFAGPWPYGQTPMLIATSRPLGVARPSARGARGSIGELVEQAKALAGDRDVYVDGGQLIRSALAEGLVDEMTVTIVPMILGAGIPLFAGLPRQTPLRLISERALGQAVELKYAPRKRG